MAHAHSLPKTVQKPEFTDYTIASTPQGLIHAAISKALYWQKQDVIRAKRGLRLDDRFWGTVLKPRPIKVRSGYPKRRERDASRQSTRGQIKALNQYKLVDRPNGEIRILQLHATRGWKAFA